jgi:hypothetical protein
MGCIDMCALCPVLFWCWLNLDANRSILVVCSSAMEYLPNANSAVSQTRKAVTTPRLHWENVSAEFNSDAGITVLRKECSKFILYKIAERLKVNNELVAIYIHIDSSRCS